MEKIVRIEQQTDAQGEATVSLKIPGTFAGLDHQTPGWVGRVISEAQMFFKNWEAGDYVKSLTLEDTDGVVPVEIRGLFPLYPIIAEWIDAEVDAANTGFYLTPGVFSLIPPGSQAWIASGLYLKAVVQKKTPNPLAPDTFYCNIHWDNRQAF